MNILDGLSKTRILLLLGLLVLSMLLLFTIEKTGSLPYRLLTAQLSPGEQITNQASATFEDAGGSQYGPVYSAINSGNTVTIIEAEGATFTITHTEEAKANFDGQITIRIYPAGTSNLAATITANAGATGQGTVTSPEALVDGQYYDIVLKVQYYLTKKLTNIQWPPTVTLNFGQTLAADLNNDDIINSIDWSNMNTNWRGTGVAADINQDNLVNTMDWGVMNKNWGVVGEE